MEKRTELFGNIAGSQLRKFGQKLFNTPADPESFPPYNTINPETPALYIHVPFCHAPLCDMCPFCRQEFKTQEATQYLGDLKDELLQYNHLDFSSVYIGGGTPATVISGLMELTGNLNLSGKNLSVEAHPQDLTPRNVEIMRQGEVTRLSVGIQSFSPELLKLMGRNNGHDPIGNLERAQQHFAVNADLIYNFAGQTINQFQGDLEQLIEIGVSQITCYPLMAVPGAFSRVDDSQERFYYRAMLDIFSSAGYSPITPWCFAKPDDTKSQGEYISDVDGEQYVGVGVSAISKVGQNFTINTFNLDEYHDRVSKAQRPVVGVRQLSTLENSQYFLLTRMFGMRLDLEEVSGTSLSDRLIRTELRALRYLGLAEEVEKTVQLTEEGMFFFSQVMKDFYTGLNFYRQGLKKQ